MKGLSILFMIGFCGLLATDAFSYRMERIPYRESEVAQWLSNHRQSHGRDVDFKFKGTFKNSRGVITDVVSLNHRNNDVYYAKRRSGDDLVHVKMNSSHRGSYCVLELDPDYPAVYRRQSSISLSKLSGTHFSIKGIDPEIVHDREGNRHYVENIEFECYGDNTHKNKNYIQKLRCVSDRPWSVSKFKKMVSQSFSVGGYGEEKLPISHDDQEEIEDETNVTIRRPKGVREFRVESDRFAGSCNHKRSRKGIAVRYSWDRTGARLDSSEVRNRVAANIKKYIEESNEINNLIKYKDNNCSLVVNGKSIDQRLRYPSVTEIRKALHNENSFITEEMETSMICKKKKIVGKGHKKNPTCFFEKTSQKFKHNDRYKISTCRADVRVRCKVGRSHGDRHRDESKGGVKSASIFVNDLFRMPAANYVEILSK